ncbi:MAG TPA: carbamoyltransferase HypF [Planctomycetota bacterium]|nr:carbamoyltransferase HypF [Planctomycetota bacterium]
MAPEVARYRVHVRGAVQGVGFRPYVYRLARSLGLSGWVRNDSSGVLIEVEGPREHCDGFVARLAPEAPPVADVAEVRHEAIPIVGGVPTRRDTRDGDVPPTSEAEFIIVKSERLPEALAEIPPDMGLCDDCRRELLDPADRRFRYPFINCTNCGPRFTIAESLPYDRPFTSMKRFTMCADCQREYDDPADRRFHAQPNACWVCGPRLSLLDPGGQPVPCDDPIAAVAHALRDGQIAAIKGLGGFHLACDATNQAAVRALRERKWREKKPFAVMVPDLEAAARLCELTAAEVRLLASWRKPIVLARKRNGHPLADGVAPASQFFGLMLPYTPVHVLLMQHGFVALVMTSANRTDEPIAIGNAEALERLASVADLFLVHDRDIIRRSDDSVMRAFRGQPIVQRRARGEVPRAIPVQLPLRAPTAQPLTPSASVLALGGDLKNTICLIRKGRAYLSQHIGDLDHADALAFFEETIEHFQSILETRPSLVAHDLHPGYHLTAYARRRNGVGLVGVQHHHAHAASVLAEHGLEGPVIGVSLDGTGYGTDGKVWGGEFLVATLADFERLAHLAYVPMPGSERAIKEPWRMTLAYLATQASAAIAPQARPLCHQELERAGVPLAELAAVQELLDKGVACPETSSMGRLFDGVSALLGICTRVSYEGQAAIELEAAAEAPDGVYYPFSLDVTSVPWTISPREVLRSVLDDLRRGTPRGLIAARFHSTIIEVVRAVCGIVRRERGLRTVALSGGCFQNLRLLEGAVAALERDGFDVRYHRLVPTNDGGLSLGQAVVALARARDS